eukprot:7388173-Prymnesium_polylepis.1
MAIRWRGRRGGARTSDAAASGFSVPTSPLSVGTCAFRSGCFACVAKGAKQVNLRGAATKS